MEGGGEASESSADDDHVFGDCFCVWVGGGSRVGVDGKL